MKRILSLTFIWVLTTLPVSANLLSNGNFNSGDLTGWWTWVGADPTHTVAVDSAYTYDGSPNAVIGSAASTWRAALGQDPDIGANVTYNLSFVYSATATPTWGSAAVSITYYDSGWNYNGYEWAVLYDQQPGPNAEGQWLLYDNNFVTPANTAHMDIQLDVWNWTTLHLDNVSLTPVPEPGTAALLVLAGCLIASRRKA